MSDSSKHLKVLLLVAGLLLCLAVIPVWPYGYFTFLRLVVCGAAGYAAFMVKNHDSLSNHFVPLLILAILFNPFVPVHLNRMLWLLIDLGCAVYFLQLAKKI